MCFLSPIPEKLLTKSEKVYKDLQKVDVDLDLLLVNISRNHAYYSLISQASVTTKNILKRDLESMWSNELILNKIKNLVSIVFSSLDTGGFFLCLKTVREEEKEN